MLKIYGRANAMHVRRVLWLADEIGLHYVRSDWGRGYRSTSEPEFARLSPFGRVPVIDDNGVVVRESNTILRYLARKASRTDLFPTDLLPMTNVEAWMDWAATDLYCGSRPVFLALVMKTPGFQDPRLVELGIYEWTREMRMLDRHLATKGPYLTGSGFTIADIVVGLVVNRWYQIAFSKPDLPAVSAYYELLSKREPYLDHGRNGPP